MKILQLIDNKKVQLVIVFSILLLAFFKSQSKKNSLDVFKEKGDYVIGKIIGHNVSGFHENFYVKFSYQVNGKIYTKSVNYRGKFRDCYKTKKCIGKKYTVYFNKNNPEQAYIDFEDER